MAVLLMGRDLHGEAGSLLQQVWLVELGLIMAVVHIAFCAWHHIVCSRPHGLDVNGDILSQAQQGR